MPKKRNAQSAVELMVILAIGLAILLVIIEVFFKSHTSFSSQLEAKKAKAAVDSLADAADMVYQQGIGSRIRIYVAIPDNINYINLTDGLILMNLNDASGNQRSIYRTPRFNLSGYIPAEQGNLFLYVESKEGYVRIGHNMT